MPGKVFVALSGGVDSAVAAFLLKQQGCGCEGFTLQMFDSAPQISDAAAVAEKLKIPFRVIDARREFESRVVEPFVSCYMSGGTPNPCVDCNRGVKFGMMFDRLLSQEPFAASSLATGHYAQTNDGRLYKAADGKKDQSYFLYTLTRGQLPRVLFPLGKLTKTEVRAIAEAQGFHNAHKPESQDICFVPGGDYAGFIEARAGKLSLPGDFVSSDGSVLGKHGGIIRGTVGQRKGFGISFSKRMYVTGKDAAANTVTLGGEEDLFSNVLTAENVNWLIDAPDLPRSSEFIRLQAKTRYNQKEAVWAKVFCVGAAEEKKILVEFEEPQRAVTRGQHIVLYDGEQVVGGGVIKSVYI